jgi:hypothetical protein
MEPCQKTLDRKPLMRTAPLLLALLLCLTLPPLLAQEPAASAPTSAEPDTSAAVTTPPEQPIWPAVGEANSQLSDRIPPEQQLWLEAGADRFFARMRPELTGQPRGAILILHDAGQHPSWPLTVAALFDELPLHGWHTLALELPAPASAAPLTAPSAPAAEPAGEPVQPPASIDGALDAQPSEGLSALEQLVQRRIDTALGQLAAVEGIPPSVALIAFGHSAPRAAEALRRRGEQTFRALVLVDAVNEIPGIPLPLPRLLPLSEAPVEDLVQSEGHLALAAQEERRQATLRQRQRIYRVAQLPPLSGGERSVLIKRIRGFLQQQSQLPAAQGAVTPALPTATR